MKTVLSHNERRVLSLLSFGVENATTCKNIAQHTSLSIRTVRQCIKSIVTKHKIPIIGNRKGSNRGYFIPRNEFELIEGIRALQSQLNEEQKRLEILRDIDFASLEWRQ